MGGTDLHFTPFSKGPFTLSVSVKAATMLTIQINLRLQPIWSESLGELRNLLAGSQRNIASDVSYILLLPSVNGP